MRKIAWHLIDLKVAKSGIIILDARVSPRLGTPGMKTISMIGRMA